VDLCFSLPLARSALVGVGVEQTVVIGAEGASHRGRLTDELLGEARGWHE